MVADHTGNYQSQNRLSIKYERMCGKLNCIIEAKKPILVRDPCINNQLPQPFIAFLPKMEKGKILFNWEFVVQLRAKVQHFTEIVFQQ